MLRVQCERDAEVKAWNKSLIERHSWLFHRGDATHIDGRMIVGDEGVVEIVELVRHDGVADVQHVLDAEGGEARGAGQPREVPIVELVAVVDVGQEPVRIEDERRGRVLVALLAFVFIKGFGAAANPAAGTNA